MQNKIITIYLAGKTLTSEMVLSSQPMKLGEMKFNLSDWSDTLLSFRLVTFVLLRAKHWQKINYFLKILLNKMLNCVEIQIKHKDLS